VIVIQIIKKTENNYIDKKSPPHLLSTDGETALQLWNFICSLWLMRCHWCQAILNCK